MNEINRLKDMGEFPPLELMTERFVLEGFTPEQLRDIVLDGCNRISDIEKVVHIANDILENGYGIIDNIVLGEE